MRNKLELLSLDESPPPPPVSPPSGAPPWTELPSDVTANILQRLRASDILESAQLVCTTWWKVCQDPAMWRVIKVVTQFFYDDELMNCDIACRRAVDRSQGQLVDLHITYDGDAELLDYIVNRDSTDHLISAVLHSTLTTVPYISGAAVSEAVKKLPELEELRLLSNSTEVVPSDIESIATSCPSLNSFGLNLSQDSISYDEYAASISHNEYAVAISKFMPGLHHLQLDDCEMDNIGLEAILDGCPHLQSLHLQGGCGVDLGGALGERCRDQIKDLVIPVPSDDDYDFDDYGNDYGGNSDHDYWGI